jgi:hypothetical protein
MFGHFSVSAGGSSQMGSVWRDTACHQLYTGASDRSGGVRRGGGHQGRIAPLSLPKPPWPRPSPRTPLEASPSPILRGLSRPRWGRVQGGQRQKGFCSSFYIAAVVKPPGIFLSFLHALGAVSHRPDWCGGFPWRWDLLSPTICSPCGLERPSPDSLCVLRRELEGLWEATPSLRRLL